MATLRIPILRNLRPDTSGSVLWTSSIGPNANDRFDFDVIEFKDTATALKACTTFAVPHNWTNGAGTRIIARCFTTAIVNAFVLTVAYKSIAAGESADPSTDDEALSVTTTVPGTARQFVDVVFDLDESKLAVDDTVELSFGRDGSNVLDLLAASLWVAELWFEYIG